MAATGPPRRGPFMKRAAISQPREAPLPSIGDKWQKADMKALLPIAALGLAACNPSPVASDADNAAIEAKKATQVMVANPQPGKLESKTGLLSWEVSWPAEVSAYPPLVAMIRGPAEKDKAEYEKSAREDREEREKSGFPWNGAYEYSVGVEVAGDTPRLLSLARSHYEFSGGAHPNHGTDAILWDREGWREIKVAELFSEGEKAFADLFTKSFCDALDAQRRENRGNEPLGDADDPFEKCPAFDELAIIPTGEKGKPMTTLLFHADPYVAGPYAEGDYDIELPVSAAMIAALKPEYRASFAAEP